MKTENIEQTKDIESSHGVTTPPLGEDGRGRAPYIWVPSLYLAESLPYSAVMLISVIMFKEMQLTDGQITLYTGWLGLPWVIKPI